MSLRFTYPLRLTLPAGVPGRLPPGKVAHARLFRILLRFKLADQVRRVQRQGDEERAADKLHFFNLVNGMARLQQESAHRTLALPTWIRGCVHIHGIGCRQDRFPSINRSLRPKRPYNDERVLSRLQPVQEAK